jgi:putative oxygen-independent coproporphyrinogen III oxidase
VIGLYIHVPYCTVRCSYCDFYLVPVRGRDLPGFADALCNEIGAVEPPLRGRAADTVHFGGGTPSLLHPLLLARILEALRSVFSLAGVVEIGLEANPEDLDEVRLEALADLGVSRISIGVQSLNDRSLVALRRPHTAEQALLAVDRARHSKVRSIGADLILGIPGQDRAETLEGVRRLEGRGVDHLSLYLLEIHDRSRLGRQVTLGRSAPLPDDQVAGLYEEAADLLTARGFEHYEISNFARPGHRSRHNLKYWTDQEYLGFGPSAHSYALGRRWANASHLGSYLASRGRSLGRAVDSQSAEHLGAEALIAGLRISDGVDLAVLRRRYGTVVPTLEDAVIEDMERASLLERCGDRLRLARRGRLVSNEVFERLLFSSAQLT